MQNLQSLERTLDLLARTPRVLDPWLRGLPEDIQRRNEGPDTFSAFDVVGHLIHGEEHDWIERSRIILEHGEARPFEPFDRFAQQGEPKAATMEAQLDLFAELRTANVAAVRDMGLREADLARTGMHPALGVVTLGQMLSTWCAHDQVHVRQIARLLAEEQRGEVGPWVEYLPLLA